MEREELADASEELKQVSGRVDDGEVKERLENQAGQLRELAAADRDPDHGRLDRHMHALSDLRGQVDGDLAERIGHARDSVRAYRETVEGV